MARQFERGGRVGRQAAQAVQPAVVAAQGGAVLVEGGGAVFAAAEGFGQVVLQVAWLQRVQVAVVVGFGELVEQAAVGGRGLRRFAAFVAPVGEVVVEGVPGRGRAAVYPASSP